MNTYQKNELVKLLSLIVVSGLIGSLVNQPWLFIVVALLVYIAFTLRNVFRLHNWIMHRKEQKIPESGGYWGEVFNEIHLMEKERAKNRKRLTNILIRFRKAATALPDGTVILTKNNLIDWANKSATRMLGIHASRDTGRQISNLIRHPDFMTYMQHPDFSQHISIPSPAKPGHTLHLQIIPFGSSQKLLLCRDVTHIAKLEEMRTAFIANVSHELRSPITVLNGYLETLQDIEHKDPAVLAKALANMHEQSRRMERLVIDLLALTKLETTPAHTRNESVDVSAMLASLKESADLLSSNKKHHITLHSDNEIKLIGNHDELNSLFSNLINNAVRYTPAEGDIDILWEKTDKGARFVVNDTGPGIPHHHLSRLTERFYRVDIDRSRESGGTGLGLAIVKHVAERHDGSLNISSALDHGSSFMCYFPSDRIEYK